MAYLDERTVYVFVRQDIPVEHQLVQANHAVFEMAKYLECDRSGIPSMIVVGMPNAKALDRVLTKLAEHGIDHTLYAEPDRVHSSLVGVTAVATAPLSKAEKLPLANYRLWKHGAGFAQATCSVTADCPANSAGA